MKFGDEYKNEMSMLAPDEETAERIRNGVMKRIAEDAPAKKPLPLRRIAVVGGSIAACLVIGVTAIALTKSDRQFLSSGSGGMNMADNLAPSTGANIAGGADGAQSAPAGNNAIAEEFGGGQNNVHGGFADAGEESVDFAQSVYDKTGEPEQSIASARPADSFGGGERDDTALVTLDDDLLTLEYNGETRLFRAVVDSAADNGGSEDNSPDESAERIKALSPDGRIMFIELFGDELLLFDSENRAIGKYVFFTNAN
ncbi:MAG: hypothetical protein NC299_02295 [Lachnospiraceae bacterium]|nr:hypothetical protein [Ruminococcus sp.]MCM1274179.1 hypothetical protein [Lachnospiraceae bacterium]